MRLADAANCSIVRHCPLVVSCPPGHRSSDGAMKNCRHMYSGDRTRRIDDANSSVECLIFNLLKDDSILMVLK